MTNDIIESTATAVPATAPAASDPVSMLDRALERGADPETLSKLMDLEERWQAKGARAEFFDALSSFQVECPPVRSNRQGAHRVPYADLPHMLASVRPSLAAHGLSVTFEQTVTESSVTVTACVHHRGGHTERTSWTGPRDEIARMSGSQSMQSVTTYGSRQALKLALGLIVSDELDDDGAEGRAAPLTEHQAADLAALIKEHKLTREDLEPLLRLHHVERVRDIPAAAYGETRAAILERVRRLAP